MDKAVAQSPRQQGAIANRIRRLFVFRESGVLAVLVIVFTVMWFVSPTFRSPFNLMTILRQMSVTAVLAAGQTLAIISGAFDLSQGPVAALAGMLSALALKSFGLPPIVAILLALLIGALAGLFNGLLITWFRFEPVVATLATSSIYTGIMYRVTRAYPVLDLPPGFVWLGQADIGRVPACAVVMVLVAFIVHLLLKNAIFGRHIFLVGSNKEAARLAGINVERTQIGIFTLSSLLSGLAGVLLVGRMNVAIPAMGSQLMLPTVAAAVVGGTLLSGGVGSMLGTIMGAAIMAILRNAIVVLQINILLQDVVVGIATVLAVLMDQFRRGNLSLQILLGKKH